MELFGKLTNTACPGGGVGVVRSTQTQTHESHREHQVSTLSHRKLPTCQARDALKRAAQLFVRRGTMNPTPLLNPSGSQYRTWTKLAEGIHRCKRSVSVWQVLLKLAWPFAFGHTRSVVHQVDATVSIFHLSAIGTKVAVDLVSVMTGSLRSLQGTRETLEQDSLCLPRLQGAVGVFFFFKKKNSRVVERKGCHGLFLVSLFRWFPGRALRTCRNAHVSSSGCEI